MLEKPHQKSKPKDHAALLERRLKLWEQGNLGDLLDEGRAGAYEPPKGGRSRQLRRTAFQSVRRCRRDLPLRRQWEIPFARPLIVFIDYDFPGDSIHLKQTVKP